MADRNIWTTASPTVNKGWARQAQSFGGTFALVTGDLALNKTVSLFKVPANFTITSIHGYVPQLDSNVSPTLTISIGDAGSATRLLSAATTAQAGGTITAAYSTALGYQFTAETEIVFKASAAAATAVAGSLVLFVNGYID